MHRYTLVRRRRRNVIYTIRLNSFCPTTTPTKARERGDGLTGNARGVRARVR